MLGSRHWPTLSRGNKTALRELHLGECHIGDKGTKALAEALQRNRWLPSVGSGAQPHRRFGCRGLGRGTRAEYGLWQQNWVWSSQSTPHCWTSTVWKRPYSQLFGHFKGLAFRLEWTPFVRSPVILGLAFRWGGRLSCDHL